MHSNLVIDRKDILSAFWSKLMNFNMAEMFRHFGLFRLSAESLSVNHYSSLLFKSRGAGGRRLSECHAHAIPIRVCVGRMFQAFSREVDRCLTPRRLLARFMLSRGLRADCRVQTVISFENCGVLLVINSR